MKGIILAGGTGSRLEPLTRVINKHLLPVGRVPMIFYPLRSLVEAGIREIMIVTGGNNAGMFLELLGSGKDFGLDHIDYAYQERPGGIAEALGLANHFVDGDRCVVHLADNFLAGSLRPYVARFEAQERGAMVLLTEVPNPQAYGVADLAPDGALRRIIEKPAEPPSSYAVTGVYMYDEQVWEIIPGLQRSGRGELEITDVNNAYLERGQLAYGILDCEWGDAGESHRSYLAANEVAWRHNLFAEFDRPSPP
ncbi:MAG: spore coat protein [Armatimonadetes bacterium]|nr:spore coat protein [Armatimonadota bacterium]